jgi:two-component system response regulator AlgR
VTEPRHEPRSGAGELPAALRQLEVLIVDDEALARLRLRQLLGSCSAPGARVVAEADSAADALAWLARHRCDLLLLDIHMPGISGLQLAERLRLSAGLDGGPAPAVVFVTAHVEHALEAFEVEAVDYLTKPVRAARLQQALARADAWLQRGGAVTAAGASGFAPLPVPDEGPPLLVHQRGELLRIPLRDILYLRADAKYVQLRTPAQSHWLDESLAELEQRLGERFLRIHRNALVARDHIRALARHPGVAATSGEGEGWAVQVAGTLEWLAVSRRQLAQVRRSLELPVDGA